MPPSSPKRRFEIDPSLSSAGQVFERLRGAIVSLEWPPGTVVNRSELQLRFRLSSTPIRDALMRLAEEGLVDIFPQSATRVSLIDVAKARQTQFLRRSVELEVARTLCEGPDKSVIAVLRDLIEQQKDVAKRADLVRFEALDLEFHRRMFEAAGAATAQDKYPSRPITVIVPFAAGGNTDVMARIFAEQLAKRLGQQLVVENRAGAGGVTGLGTMSKAAPDGYTIGVGTSGGLAINPVLIKDKMPYNVEKDLTYIYGMAAMPNLWVVHPSVPANNLGELVTWLKANPGTPYATSGIGTSQHLCGEMLSDVAGLKITPVAYRASNQSMQDLVGGQIKLSCDNFSIAIEQVNAKLLRAVAITSAGRYPLAPEIQPTGDTLAGLEQMPAFGWVGPANMPAGIVSKLTEGLIAVGKLPEVRASMEKFGVQQTELAGPAYAESLAKERAGYATLIEKAGIKAP